MDQAPDVSSRVDHALRQAAARAYEAAHGVLGEDLDPPEPPTWRWDVSPRVLVSLGITVAIIGCIVVWAPRPAPTLSPPPRSSSMAVTDSGATHAAQVSVHVAGAVHEPGVYTLPVNSRVTDAIDAAGGAGAAAHLDSINLARHIVDGERVYVPAVDEVLAGGALAGDGRININAATASQLEDLPGVGPVLAGRIIAFREQHGLFATVEALMAVTGVGPVLVAGLTDAATV